MWTRFAAATDWQLISAGIGFRKLPLSAVRVEICPVSTVLIVFLLSIQSSYQGNIEQDASDDVFDTVQFFCSDGTCWRIKTYASDQDVHVWNIGEIEDIVSLARESTEKHYGDVLTEMYVLRSASGLDGIREKLVARGLSSTLEVSSAGFAFWAPAGTRYRTKSKPQDN